MSVSEQDGRPSAAATVQSPAHDNSELLADLRWLMEDYLEDQSAAGRFRAVKVRQALSAEGARLFGMLFESSDDCTALWSTISGRLSATRFEVDAPITLFDAIMWELVQPTGSRLPLCLAVHSFVRTERRNDRPWDVQPIPECRVLLITSRPRGAHDVSYRAIASRVVDTLAANPAFDLTFLRPPTFAECVRILQDAQEENRPYDLIHFDGHGFASEGGESSILFEDQLNGAYEAVSASEFARLTSATGPKAIVLNACRSAQIHAREDSDPESPATAGAISSFAHTLAGIGCRVVIAMKYNVCVPSAVTFVTEMYRQLGRGRSLVDAACLSRRSLAIDARRTSGLEAFEIEDWVVPVVLQSGDDVVIHSHDKGHERRQATADLASASLPLAPEVGFVGADDALLAIDRAFDNNSVVLLHGLAGAGKTASAVEFARWLRKTGGLSGPVLFTAFEQPPTVEQMLSATEPVFSPILGPEWTRGGGADKISLLRQALSRQPVFWIWDNIESIRQLPVSEQERLITFLRTCAVEGGKFLLTSRAAEEELLGLLPSRVEIPPLRHTEAIEFVRRLIVRLGAGRRAVEVLLPIVTFCEGNPLTLSVAVSTVLFKDPNPTPSVVDQFISSIESGESTFKDDEGLGPSRSLRASLQTGLSALNLNSRRRLALLFLFRSYVNTHVLLLMCRPVHPTAIADRDYDVKWNLTEFAGDSIHSLENVLLQASQVGLLRRAAENHYWMHPAIQSHLHASFRKYFPAAGGFARCARAFSEALGMFGITFTQAHAHGWQAGAIEALSNEELNFRHALQLSWQYQWPQATIGILHALHALYWHTGRRSEWARLFEDVVPMFIADDHKAISGQERWWSFLMDHSVRLAIWRRELDRAEDLARLILQHDEAELDVLRQRSVAADSHEYVEKVRSCAICMGRLADILQEQGNAEALECNERALSLYREIDDNLGISIRLFNLGHVFKNIPVVKDLRRAEQYYNAAYNSYSERNDVGRGQCLGQLGAVALARLKEELSGSKRPDVLAREFVTARDYYEQAHSLMDADDPVGLAESHNQLGVVHQYADDGAGAAYENFALAVRFADIAGEEHLGASARNNAAQLLDRAGRFVEALVYAEEALAYFSRHDGNAAMEEHLVRLIESLRRKIGRQGGPDTLSGG